MSVLRLLASFDQQATISNPTEGAEDDFGNPTDTWNDEGTWPCRLWQTTGTELNENRDTQIGTYQLAVGPTAPITGRSRVTVDGSTFEVDGPPLHRRTPRGPSHITATLKAFT